MAEKGVVYEEIDFSKDPEAFLKFLDTAKKEGKITLVVVGNCPLVSLKNAEFMRTEIQGDINMAQNYKLKVFSMAMCGDCVHAKNLLDEKGVVYEEIDISKDPAAGDLLEEKTGKRGVPYFLINDEEWWRAYTPREPFDPALIKNKLGL